MLHEGRRPMNKNRHIMTALEAGNHKGMDELTNPESMLAVEGNYGDYRYCDYRWARSNVTAAAEEPIFSIEVKRSSL